MGVVPVVGDRCFAKCLAVKVFGVWSVFVVVCACRVKLSMEVEEWLCNIGIV